MDSLLIYPALETIALILVAQTLKLGGFTIAKAKKKQIKQKKTKSKQNKIIEVSVRWGGARLLYLNYDGVRGVPERGCSRGWQPPRMGQWRGERERGGVGAPSRSGRTAPILPIFNDQEAKSDLGLTILTTGKIVQMAIDFNWNLYKNWRIEELKKYIINSSGLSFQI